MVYEHDTMKMMLEENVVDELPPPVTIIEESTGGGVVELTTFGENASQVLTQSQRGERRNILGASTSTEACVEEKVEKLCIGDIKLQGLIALGSFGALCQGMCGDTKVAIKHLRSKWLDNKHAQNDFRNEILMLSKCSHPNIVMFLGCVDDAVENIPKLVALEWVDGGNLFDAIHKEKDGPRELLPSERLHFINFIALGMQYLHSNNPYIIHRDLKPHNLLLPPRRRRGRGGRRPRGRRWGRGAIWFRERRAAACRPDCRLWAEYVAHE